MFPRNLFPQKLFGFSLLPAILCLTGIRASAQGSGVYSHPWNQNLGTCAVPPGWPSTFPVIARRAEMVFINGIALTQVMSSSDLRPGTFFVDDGAGTIFVHPAAGVSIWNSTV